MNSFYEISKSLGELADKVPSVYTKAREASLRFQATWDDIALTSFNNYGSQSLRDSHNRKAIAETPVWEPYQIAIGEKEILDMVIRLKIAEGRMLEKGSYQENVNGWDNRIRSEKEDPIDIEH